MVDSKHTLRAKYWQIAWPAALEGLLIVLLSSVDLLMISSLGAQSVAAIGIFSQPKMVILCFSRSMAVAVTAIVALWHGEGRHQELSHFVKQSLTITLGIALVIWGITTYWMRPILYIAGAETIYIEEAQTYGLITNASLLIQALVIVLNSGLTGLGRTKAMLLSNVSGNLVNVVFNGLFIYGLHLGVRGAALATLLGSCMALGLSITFACQKGSLIALGGRVGWLPTKKSLQAIGNIFGGVFLEQGFERIGMFLYSFFVAKLGVVSFATHCICMTLCDVFYNFGQGFSKASLTLSARLKGEGKTEQIKTLTQSVTPLCLIAATLAALIYYVGRAPLMQLYSDETAVKLLGEQILVFVAIGSFPQTLSLCYSGILRGLGYTKYVARYSFWSIAFMRPIITYVLVFVVGLDLYGAWTALLIDQTTRMLCACYKIRKENKQTLIAEPVEVQ